MTFHNKEQKEVESGFGVGFINQSASYSNPFSALMKFRRKFLRDNINVKKKNLNISNQKNEDNEEEEIIKGKSIKSRSLNDVKGRLNNYRMIKSNIRKNKKKKKRNDKES